MNKFDWFLGNENNKVLSLFSANLIMNKIENLVVKTAISDSDFCELTKEMNGVEVGFLKENLALYKEPNTVFSLCCLCYKIQTHWISLSLAKFAGL